MSEERTRGTTCEIHETVTVQLAHAALERGAFPFVLASTSRPRLPTLPRSWPQRLLLVKSIRNEVWAFRDPRFALVSGNGDNHLAETSPDELSRLAQPSPVGRSKVQTVPLDFVSAARRR